MHEFTYSFRGSTHICVSVYKCHSGNHLLSQSNHILMAAVKDIATCSPTELESQGSAGHVSHMFACGFPGFLCSLYIRKHTRRLLRCTCVHALITQCYICTPPYTSFTFKCHTHCVSLESYLAVWCPVSLASLRDKSSWPKQISHRGKRQFVWNPEICCFMFRIMREKMVWDQVKSVVRGLSTDLYLTLRIWQVKATV